MSWSASRKDTPKRAARRRPTEVFPAPIIPTSATVRFRPFFDPLMGPRLHAGAICRQSPALILFVSGMIFVQNAPMRSSYRTRRVESLGPLLLMAGGVFLAVMVLGAIGLGIYGSSVSVAQHPVEQELPDARFTR